jgi:dTDP-4-dehydrorhamnose 3,5-epimerase
MSGTLRVEETSIPGVKVLAPRVFGDDRGFFLETFNKKIFAELHLPSEFMQDNHSRSLRGVLRGLHYQLAHPQGKLVRVTRGKIFDVAADVRRGSPTFGKWVGTVLDDVSLKAVWIPPGFAHGFCALSDVADVVYKCTELYTPADERGIRWDDPTLAVEWPIHDLTLSAKDLALPQLDPASSDLPNYERA